MKAPRYEQPPLDPAFASLTAKTQQEDIVAIQGGLQRDTASILARYGANLSLAGAGGMTPVGNAATPGSPLLRKVA